MAVPVGVLVGAPLVALFAVDPLQDAVAAEDRQEAAGSAHVHHRRCRHVGVDVQAVVAELGRVLRGPVAAVRAELAFGGALAVGAGAGRHVGRSAIALFAADGVAVSANRSADARRAVESLQRELEVRLDDLALGVEHRDLVHAPGLEAEAQLGARRSGLIEVILGADRRRSARRELERAAELLVDAAEVEDELTVDEDPEVVVTEEDELLASPEDEPVARFGREAVVVTAVARRLSAGCDPTLTVEREKAGVGCPGTRCRTRCRRTSSGRCPIRQRFRSA